MMSAAYPLHAARLHLHIHILFSGPSIDRSVTTENGPPLNVEVGRSSVARVIM